MYTWNFEPVIESGWTESALHLRAVLPGVSEKDVQVSVQQNRLQIEGERKQPEGLSGASFTRLTYGPFAVGVKLPSGLNLEKVSCRLNHGVLDIEVPVLEAAKPKTVAIEVGAKPAAAVSIAA